MKVNDILAKFSDYEPTILGQNSYQKFSLLIPLVEVYGETHILFEVRSLQMNSQPGDVCFPGGRVDKEDKSVLDSAIRETEEELGIDRKYITNVTPLDYIVSDFGRIIYPFIGKLENINNLYINKDEVEEVFTVPLAHFLENDPAVYQIGFDVVPDADFPYHLIQGGENYQWRTRKINEYFFEYNSNIIWGLTARILIHFISLMKSDNLRKDE